MYISASFEILDARRCAICPSFSVSHKYNKAERPGIVEGIVKTKIGSTDLCPTISCSIQLSLIICSDLGTQSKRDKLKCREIDREQWHMKDSSSGGEEDAYILLR